MLNVGDMIICRVAGPLVLRGLDVAPTQAVAYPVDASQCRESAELILRNWIVFGQPRNCRVDTDGRVLWCWRDQWRQYGSGGPRKLLVGGV